MIVRQRKKFKVDSGFFAQKGKYCNSVRTMGNLDKNKYWQNKLPHRNIMSFAETLTRRIQIFWILTAVLILGTKE